MKKTIMTMLLGMFFIATVSALSISAGETYHKDLTGEIENLQSFDCNLTAQNYNLNGSNFTMNKTGYILSLDLNFRKDNLTISCILNGQKWVEDNVGSSGGDYGGGMFGKRYQQTITTNESVEDNISIENETIDITEEPEVIEDKESKNKGWKIFGVVIGLIIIIILTVWILRNKK